MSPKYNILLLFADQFRFDAMGCAGNQKIHTPNLDALAASGQRFSQAFTPNPVCVPARMSLITGHYGSRTHFVDNEKLPGPEPVLPTIMTCLHDAGYHTHGVGKMHFRGKPYGFHRIETQEEGATIDYRIDDDYLMFLKANKIRTRYPHGYRNLLYFQPQTNAMPEEFSPEAWVADRSIKFLQDHLRYRGDTPFFLWSSWIAPHPPFAACEPYASMYSPDDMEMPYYAERPLSDLPAPAWPHRGRLDGALYDPERMRRIKSLYYGKVSHVDYSIGRVLQKLERLGLAENTIVIFTSDHGEMLGDHGLSQKNVPYEPSSHIPFIIRWPGIAQTHMTNDGLISLLDVFPTLIDGVGLEYPSENGPLPGKSFYIPSGLTSSRDHVVIEYGSEAKRWISIRSKSHKYTLWASGGHEELYNLDKDPQERHNLFQEQSQLVSDFRSKVLAWEKEHGLPDSFERDQFRIYPEPAPPTEEECRHVTINEGKWVDNLPEDEKGTIESYEEAIKKALSKETFDLNKLSVEEYIEKTGHKIDELSPVGATCL